MYHRLLFSLSLLGMSFKAMSQPADSPAGFPQVHLNSVLGLAAPGLSSLNQELSQAGYLPLPAVYLVRGAGFYSLFPKLRLASIFNFSSYSGTRTEQGRSSWVRSSTAGTALGFIVKTPARRQVIPYAGIVYSWFGIRLSKQAPGSPTVTGYLAAKANQHQLAREQFSGNLGVHLAQVGLGRGGLSRKLIMGLRVGYLTPLHYPAWKTNATSLSGGPLANPGGWYGHLILGSALY